jgi:hypothetical protein
MYGASTVYGGLSKKIVSVSSFEKTIPALAFKETVLARKNS